MRMEHPLSKLVVLLYILIVVIFGVVKIVLFLIWGRTKRGVKRGVVYMEICVNWVVVTMGVVQMWVCIFG